MNKSIPEIEKLSQALDKESKALIRDTLRLAWQMRGAISANEAYMLTLEEREAIVDIIKENIEWTEKTQLPYI